MLTCVPKTQSAGTLGEVGVPADTSMLLLEGEGSPPSGEGQCGPDRPTVERLSVLTAFKG